MEPLAFVPFMVPMVAVPYFRPDIWTFHQLARITVVGRGVGSLAGIVSVSPDRSGESRLLVILDMAPSHSKPLVLRIDRFDIFGRRRYVHLPLPEFMVENLLSVQPLYAHRFTPETGSLAV